jgi:FkbM family methyltransferase
MGTPRHLTEPYWYATLKWHGDRRWHFWQPERREYYRTAWAFRRALETGSGKVFIDCGANVGNISAMALAHGMLVHAFEPDPLAVTELRCRLGTPDGLTIHQAAVGAFARIEMLRCSTAGTLASTEGSSIVASPDNGDFNRTEVAVIDLFDFVGSLDRPVAALKLDIEGAEAEILERMLAEPLAIPFVFVETHERMSDDLDQRLTEIRTRIRHERMSHIYLGWP